MDSNITNYTLYVGRASGQYDEVIHVGMPLMTWTNAPGAPLPPHTSTNLAVKVGTPMNTWTNAQPLAMPATAHPITPYSGTTYGCVYTNVVPGRWFYMVITCQNNQGLESDPSNELGFNMGQLKSVKLEKH